ncbi:MAG: hypothetical protein AAB071_04165 [Bacteroidota bacterium]
MKFKQHTIHKFSDFLVRIGEAAIIGSVATFFATDFPHSVSITGIITGVIAAFVGFYIDNLTD